MTVLAIVVNYNTTDDLELCVDALMSNAVDEVVVHDNASPDPAVRSTLATLADRYGTSENPRFRVELGERNDGFGAGINGVIEVAPHFDYYWFVNPDSIPEPDCAAKVVAAMDQFHLDIASPVITTGQDAQTIWFAGGVLHRDKGLSEHVIVVDDDVQVVESSFITGAAMFVRHDAWIELGGFRPDLFLYWEDAELCARATEAGMTLGTVTDASVWHRVGASGGVPGMSRDFHYYMNRNRLVVCGAYSSRTSVLLGRGARITLRMIRAATREPNAPLQKTAAGLRGAVAGLRYKHDESVARQL